MHIHDGLQFHSTPTLAIPPNYLITQIVFYTLSSGQSKGLSDKRRDHQPNNKCICGDFIIFARSRTSCMAE